MATTLTKDANGNFTVKPTPSLATLTPFDPAKDTARTKEEALLIQQYNLTNPSPYMKSLGMGGSAMPSIIPQPGMNMTPNAPATPAPQNFNDLSKTILQDYQKKNADQFTGNQAALFKGKENMQETNANTYSKDLLDANLSNEARLALLSNDGGLQQPGFKSIEAQQGMNEAHYKTSQDALNLALKAIEPKNQPASVQEYEYAKANGYTGSFEQYQNEDANRKAKIAGLTSGQQQSTINQITGAFDNEPVVRNYNTIAEGYQFAKSLVGKKESTSADDQGLIYAFAKAMDPGSVVREGEYATVQKYAQSWAQTFGFNVQRMFSNQPFLTAEAKANMLATIDAKYNSSKQGYDNIYKSYQKRIEDAKSGQVGGSVVDYSAAYGNGASGTERKTVNGVEYEKVDGGWKKVSFNPAGNASASKEIVAGYDITSYATDPTHGAKVQQLYSSLPAINSIHDVNSYISRKYPNSPVSGEAVITAADKYDVDPRLMLAIMIQDSSLGTAGKAVKTHNPGNVGNTDSGATKNYGDWDAGVEAVAKNLSWRKIA